MPLHARQVMVVRNLWLLIGEEFKPRRGDRWIPGSLIILDVNIETPEENYFYKWQFIGHVWWGLGRNEYLWQAAAFEIILISWWKVSKVITRRHIKCKLATAFHLSVIHVCLPLNVYPRFGTQHFHTCSLDGGKTRWTFGHTYVSNCDIWRRGRTRICDIANILIITAPIRK